MTNLDNPNSMKKLDKSGVLKSTCLLGDQIEQAWNDAKNTKFTPITQKISNVVVFGMGGSALGAHVIQSVYGTELKVPFLFVSGYEVPGFVNQNTLTILSSYSGGTEEVLRALDECEKKGAYTIGIGAGGDLGKKLGNKLFKIIPKFNPSGHPRLGGGYMIFGLLGLLKNIGLVSVKDSEVAEARDLARELAKKFGPETLKNQAKQLAKSLNESNIIMVASEHLVGNAHTFANQLNESAKNFSSYFTLPELNHHLMEGLKFPESNKKDLKFVFLESNLYSERVRLRYKITREVVEKNKIEFESVTLKSRGKLLQTVEMLSLGSFTSFYLAMLNGVDPGEIPWVNYFKKKLV